MFLTPGFTPFHVTHRCSGHLDLGPCNRPASNKSRTSILELLHTFELMVSVHSDLCGPVAQNQNSDYLVPYAKPGRLPVIYFVKRKSLVKDRYM